MNMSYSLRKGKDDLKGSSGASGSIIDMRTLGSKAQGPSHFQKVGPPYEFQRVGLVPRDRGSRVTTQGCHPRDPEDKAWRTKEDSPQALKSNEIRTARFQT